VSRRLRIEDLLELAVPSQPALSPDGARIAYVVRTFDAEQDRVVDRLWLVGTEGDAPRRLTAGPVDTAPAWSPDGSRLAFLRDGQLAVLDLRGGEPELVTDPSLVAGAPQWSPDGHRIAFTAPVDLVGDAKGPLVSDGIDYQSDGAGMIGRVRDQVHILDLETKEILRLTDGPHGVASPTWSPDGSTLAFVRGTGPDHDLRRRTSVQLLAAHEKNAEPRVLAFADGVATTVGWTADGAALLVTGWTGDPIGHERLHRVDAKSGAVVDLTGTLDRNIMPGSPAYPGGLPHEHDGRVWFCLRDHGCTHLWSIATDGSDARPVVASDGVVVAGVSVAGGRAAIALVTPTSFGEIAVLDLVSATETTLTGHGSTLSDVDLYRRAERWFTVADGTRVQAWLVHDPAQTGPRPVLLDVHGGPHNAWNAAADAVHLYHHELVRRGWAVLLVNPRGSDGYGEAFYTGTRGGWGIVDSADFLAPLDELVAEGFADPDRLAVTGYSYGGYMTCWLTGHDDRFAAAVAGGVVSDLVSMSGTSDHGHALSAHELGSAPWQKPGDYAAMSPLSKVADVRTPTLLLHGGADVRCPLGQAQQWHTALREQGVPTRLVIYPGASHLFILDGSPAQRLDFNHRVLDWLEQHVTRAARARVDADHWQRRLSLLAERHRVPGAQLGILRLGAGGAPDDLVTAAHGIVHAGTGVPATTDALFQIGSITKVWTTTLAMMLVDEGRLDLDTPVADVLPDLVLADPTATKAITVRHLLTHTSGIDGDVFIDTGRGDDSLRKYVARLGEVGQSHSVGAAFSYCNSGFTLLGRLLEKITGQTWDQLLRTRLCEPLGLTHAVTLPEDALLHAVAVGHEECEGRAVAVQTWTLPRSSGPGSAITARAADVLAFARLHLAGGVAPDGTRLLSAAGAAAMTKLHAELPHDHPIQESWGLGWMRFDWDGHRLVGHDGGTIGQTAYLRMLPEQGLAVCLLTNGGRPRDLYHDLFGEVFATLAGVAMPPRFVPPPEPITADVTPFKGVYERTSQRIEVTDGPNGPLLRLTATGLVGDLVPDSVLEFALVPVGPKLFAIRSPEMDTWLPLTFYELPDGSPCVFFGLRSTMKVGPGPAG
jgi:dipeptidyl aminopeptidase/acylaminoacyl peptidase/CubicO group peptidase (beta-lactamase class C family)